MLDAGALMQHDDAGAVVPAGALVYADADAHAVLLCTLVP